MPVIQPPSWGLHFLTGVGMNHVATRKVGTNPDAELEANKAVSQLFIKATDDEKDAKLYKLFCDMYEEGKPNPRVRCAFSDRNLHSRMPLDPTHVRLKRTRV
jgi:hypothetical protein